MLMYAVEIWYSPLNWPCTAMGHHWPGPVPQTVLVVKNTQPWHRGRLHRNLV